MIQNIENLFLFIYSFSRLKDIEDTGYCNQFSYILCESCKKILEEEIRFKYNKTKKN